MIKTLSLVSGGSWAATVQLRRSRRYLAGRNSSTGTHALMPCCQHRPLLMLPTPESLEGTGPTRAAEGPAVHLRQQAVVVPHVQQAPQVALPGLAQLLRLLRTPLLIPQCLRAACPHLRQYTMPVLLSSSTACTDMR